MKLRASPKKELDEDEENEREKRKRKGKGGREREYKMRVFGEKDVEGVAGESVEGDERIVEFEMSLRKKGGRRKQRGIQSSG